YLGAPAAQVLRVDLIQRVESIGETDEPAIVERLCTRIFLIRQIFPQVHSIGIGKRRNVQYTIDQRRTGDYALLDGPAVEVGLITVFGPMIIIGAEDDPKIVPMKYFE